MISLLPKAALTRTAPNIKMAPVKMVEFVICLYPTLIKMVMYRKIQHSPKITIVARIVPICVKSQVMFWPLTITETANVLAMSSISMSGPLRKLKSCDWSREI